MKCPACDHVCEKRLELEEHVDLLHEGPSRTFSYYDSWKDFIQFVQPYVNSREYPTKRQRETWTFTCFRSGVYKPQGPSNSKKALKGMGSCKIGATCPFYLQGSLKSDGKVEVQWYNFHLGHDPENFGHKKIPETHRQMLLESVQIGRPTVAAVEDVNQSLLLEGHAGVTVRSVDLHNIKRQINKHYGVAETAESVANFCRNSPIVRYHDVKSLKEAFIIVTTTGLLKLLEKFGPSCVMIDTTHDANKYGAKLTTLQVRKPNTEFICVAFLISPREDTETYQTFFKTIIPNGFRTKIFMSDMAPAFINAWRSVVGDVPEQRICTWHVLKAWKENLNRRITCQVERNTIYLALCEVLYCRNKVEFLRKWNQLRSNLAQRTDTFWSYLEENYVERRSPKIWAHAFFTSPGPTTNMQLENFHKQLKHDHLGGRPMVRIDSLIGKTLHSIIAKELSIFQSQVVKQPYLKGETNIRRGHELGEQVPLPNITRINNLTFWVKSEKGLDSYEVVLKPDGCNHHSICLKCRPCNLCINTISCTCYMFQTQILCKHAHAVMHWFPETRSYLPESCRQDEMEELVPLRQELLTEASASENNNHSDATDIKEKWSDLFKRLQTLNPEDQEAYIREASTLMDRFGGNEARPAYNRALTQQRKRPRN